MGCCSSRPAQPVNPAGGYGQSQAMRAVLAAGVGDSSSPPPSLDLSSVGKNAHVNGRVFCELVRAGFVHLSRNYQHLNKINVFPVPDGDTGNNMVITMLPAVTAMGAEPTEDIRVAVRSVASQTALASQGNSGTIFGFMFNRLADAVEARLKEVKYPGVNAETETCPADAAAGTEVAISIPGEGGRKRRDGETG